MWLTHIWPNNNTNMPDIKQKYRLRLYDLDEFEMTTSTEHDDLLHPHLTTEQTRKKHIKLKCNFLATLSGSTEQRTTTTNHVWLAPFILKVHNIKQNSLIVIAWKTNRSRSTSQDDGFVLFECHHSAACQASLFLASDNNLAQSAKIPNTKIISNCPTPNINLICYTLGLVT